MHYLNYFSFWASLVAVSTYIAPFVGAHYAITGIKTGIDQVTGSRPARRNILDLQQDVPSWYASNEFLLALH
jgi:tyrosinase